MDAFTVGEATSQWSERLSEDGSVEEIAAEFNQHVGENAFDARTIGGAAAPGPIDPGDTATLTIDVSPGDVGRRIFTWATMIIPLNDAFLPRAGQCAGRPDR